MIHRFARLESTQDVAHQLAAEGAPEGTAVQAIEQSRGRGTRGREWSSGPGGLWLTVVLRPAVAPSLEGLSIRIGLELATLLGSRLADPTAIQLKWPNDLYAADRKLGGILCEARWIGDQPGWVAVGIGINLTNQLAPDLGRSAIRLADLGGTVEPGELVEPVVAAVERAGQHRGRLSEAELAGFAARDWLRGRRIETPVRGTAAGVASDGRLIVDQDDGVRGHVLGSVTLAGLAGDSGSH